MANTIENSINSSEATSTATQLATPMPTPTPNSIEGQLGETLSNQIETLNPDKIYSIAEINPLYRLQLDWLAQYNIDSFTTILLPVILAFILLLLLGGSIFRSMSKPPSIMKKFTNIGLTAMAFTISLLAIPPALQELDVNNYSGYMAKVANNINAELATLNDKEKNLFTFCLKDGSNLDGVNFFKNHQNSGERFDKCIIRYVNHFQNKTLRTEFKSQMKHSEHIAKTIEELRVNKLNSPLENLKENGINIKNAVNQVGAVLINSSSELLNETTNVVKEQINATIQNKQEEIKEQIKDEIKTTIQDISNNSQTVNHAIKEGNQLIQEGAKQLNGVAESVIESTNKKIEVQDETKQ